MKNVNILNFIQDTNGNNSSKRLGGLICLLQGSAMKFGLFLYGLTHKTVTSFEKLDGCADSMIYVGAGLLGWGVFEKVVNNKKNKKKC